MSEMVMMAVITGRWSMAVKDGAGTFPRPCSSWLHALRLQAFNFGERSRGSSSVRQRQVATEAPVGWRKRAHRDGWSAARGQRASGRDAGGRSPVVLEAMRVVRRYRQPRSAPVVRRVHWPLRPVIKRWRPPGPAGGV